MEKLTLSTVIKENIEQLSITEKKANNVIENIRNNIKNYVKSNNIKSLIIGVSGGLDSSVVSALCQEKYTGVPLIGVSIPMNSTNEHKEQAKWIGENYCTVFEEFNEWDNTFNIYETNNTESKETSINFIKEIFNTVSKTNSIAEKAGFNVNTFPTKILNGNIKARLRMITLYDLARKTNGMVLSTDNLSEFNMGFWTICGDVGDYGPIQNIGKGFELPIIAEQLNIRNDIIYQPPSDGLMVTEDNTDEAQLGASYKEVDFIIKMYSNEFNYKINEFTKEEQDKINKIINRYENLTYKRKGTINLSRKIINID